MIELVLVALAAMAVGILTGLLPALPVYIGPLLLYSFSPNLPLEHLLIFWFVAVVGSQFFGSVAAILTQVPGEDSALVYLKDIFSFSVEERAFLLYETALGSLFASLVAILALYTMIRLSPQGLAVFSSMLFQSIFYLLALVSFCFLNRSVLLTLGLVAIGLFMSPKNNYALPEFWIRMQSSLDGMSFFMLVLGLVLLPELIGSKPGLVRKEALPLPNRVALKHSWRYIKPTAIGMLAGLIPGPSAFLGSAFSYRTTRDKYQKVVAAETANNASVIISAAPLLLLGLPINQNTMIFSNLMEIRGVDLVAEAAAVIGTVSVAFAVCAFAYFFLSTTLIGFYVEIIRKHSTKILAVTVLAVFAMMAMDIYANNASMLAYVVLVPLLCAAGLFCKRVGINVLPLLFSYILGDRILWLGLQIYAKYA